MPKPSARTAKSENRERAMRQLAVKVLKEAGYKIISVRSPAGQQFVDVQGPNGKITIWVKCAWRPGTHGHAAVQVDFPKNYEQTIAWAKQAVAAKVAMTMERGATHMMLLGADNSGKKATTAFLAKLSDIPKIFNKTAKIHPRMARNGKSPSIYVEGPREVHRHMIAQLSASSKDLLRGQKVYQDQHGVIDSSVPIGVDRPEYVETKSGSFKRNADVRRHALDRAKGHCEYCGTLGFRMPTGEPFLETHHIVPLGKKGKDTADNVIALCPNHHREAHYGERHKLMRGELLKLVTK